MYPPFPRRVSETRGGVERVGPFCARADGEDRGANRGLGEADAELAAEGGGPGPAGEHYAAGADRSGFGDHAGDPAALELEAAGGAGLMHAGTETHRTAGDDRGGALGIGGAVGGGEDAALPGPAGRGAPFGRLRRRQHVSDDALGAGEVPPAGPAGDLGLVVREIEEPGAAEADAFADLPGHGLPKGEARGCHRQLAGVAVLLAAPPPVAARLLGADPPLLHQRHLHAAPGEIVGGAGADDAAADHHHVGSRRKGCGGFDREQRRGHRSLPVAARIGPTRDSGMPGLSQ